MRPTLLGFRSPKEKTPGMNLPRVTYDGRRLDFCGDIKHSYSFTNEKRFQQYEHSAQKTNFRIGPGSYSPENLSIGKERIKGGSAYKAFHGGKKTENNGYFFVNQNLVYEPSFVLRSKRGSLDGHDVETDVTCSHKHLSRPKTSCSSRHEGYNRFMMVQHLSKKKMYKAPGTVQSRKRKKSVAKGIIAKLIKRRFNR